VQTIRVETPSAKYDVVTGSGLLREVARSSVRCLIEPAAFVCLAICSVNQPGHSQSYTPTERGQAQTMLRDVTDDVKKHYYDPSVLGSEWDAKVKDASEKIDKADSVNRALSIIASVLDSLNDSHTSFIPPPRPYVHDYGFQMQMIGDQCYVLRVRPGSDAEAKGVKAGDELSAVNGYKPTRTDFWRMQYLFWVLRPQPGLRLLLHSTSGEDRQVDVMAHIRQLPAPLQPWNNAYYDVVREAEDWDREASAKYAERDNLLVVNLPRFLPSSSEADAVLGKMRKYSAVILDLRGNPGGSVEALQSLLGGMFETKVKIGDQVGRGSTKPFETEQHHQPFKAKMVVLIDSRSSSASEIFARTIQLEKRGIVVGDRSSGSVMESLQYAHNSGLMNYTVYGDSVTVFDIRMSDGQSLEHHGVTPDVEVIPTVSDLASGSDPALAKAAEMLGTTITPEEAGKLFPYEWPKE
jgi:carboxyl-terminal processing protease